MKGSSLEPEGRGEENQRTTLAIQPRFQEEQVPFPGDVWLASHGGPASTLPAASDCSANTALQIRHSSDVNCLIEEATKMSFLPNPHLAIPKQFIAICMFTALWTHSVKRARGFANACFLRPSLTSLLLDSTMMYCAVRGNALWGAPTRIIL